MTPTLSSDQQAAWDRLEAALAEAGVDLASGRLRAEGEGGVLAVTGKAGSGKTLLLTRLVKALTGAGLEVVSGDWERRRRDKRTLAVLAPTNKAASVLRGRGVPATTIHRILYTPVYDPQFEKLAEWLGGEGDRPDPAEIGAGLSDEMLDRAKRIHDETGSVPGALAAAGLRGSDFISGWKRREQPLDIGLVDESSMLDERGLEDLREIFPHLLVLFGDPAQLPPVKQGGGGEEMIFERLPAADRMDLTRVHRQAGDSPILDLAHALTGEIEFDAFEEMVAEAAARDDRVAIAPRVDSDLMARSPVLVWRNATRIRMIRAFRQAHGAPEDGLLPGEPLICDGLELPLKHRKRRIDLEARGLIKGAQVIYLGPGRKEGFSRLHVLGAPEPEVSVSSIIKIESPDAAEEPFLPYAARMGAAFLHGAAVTIHKAQGSQWDAVQVFSPDLYAAARAGRVEAGQALWKRLAYVAITRAAERLIWVRRYALAMPTAALGVEDLRPAAVPLTLTAEEGEDA
jgi:exodeoxyribonuclease-5